MTSILFARAFETYSKNSKMNIEFLEELIIEKIPDKLYNLFSINSNSIVIYNEKFFELIYTWNYDDKIIEYWGFLYNNMNISNTNEYINKFLYNYINPTIFDLDNNLTIVGTSIILAKDKKTLKYISLTIKDLKEFFKYFEYKYFEYDRNEILNELKNDVKDIKTLLEDSNNLICKTNYKVICKKRNREEEK